MTNTGTLQSSAGGVLTVNGSAVDNTGGQVIAQDGSEVRFAGSQLTAGTLSTEGSGQLTVTASSNVGFTNTTINGSLVTENNSDTEISGTIASSGTIQVTAGSSSTDIEVQTGGATLTGGGTVQLVGGNAGINGVDGSTLTIGDHTIEGQGSIGENTIGIVNSSSGLINANIDGETLTIDASTLGGVDNDGVIQSSDEGVLRIAGTSVDNADGLIVAQDNSEVRLNNSTITGGQIDTEFGGQFFIESSSNVRFDNIRSTANNLFSLNNSDTEIVGTFENTGQFEVQAGTSSTDIEVQAGGATLTGGGSIRLSGVNAGINGVSGSTLTIGDQTIEGQGSIGENTIGIVNSSSGLIDANVAGATLQIDASTLGGVDNDGVIQSSDEGVLRIVGTSVDNADGLIVAQDNSEVRLGNSTITGGRIDTEFGGQFFIESSSNVRFDNISSTANNLFALNNSDTEIVGTFENTGQFEVQAGSSSTDIEVQADGATLTGGGSIRLSGVNAGINAVGGGVLDIQSQLVIGEGNIGENTLGLLLGPASTIESDVNGGTLTIDTAGSNATEVLTNNGTLRASNLSVLDSVQNLDNNGTIEVRDGSTVSARTLINSSASLLTGDGVIDVETGVISVAGAVAPGDGVGVLSLSDDTVFTSTATLSTELQSDSLFDVLLINGDLNLDGQLTVDLLDGFDPLAADTFLIAEATNLLGQFSNVTDGGLIVTDGGEGSFTVNYLSNGVQLSNFTAAVPEPSSVAIMAGIGIGLFLRRRRVA